MYAHLWLPVPTRRWHGSLADSITLPVPVLDMRTEGVNVANLVSCEHSLMHLSQAIMKFGVSRWISTSRLVLIPQKLQ